jgi:hypothetical protein
MGGPVDFSKNLPASLFNEDLSNEPNFGRTVPLIAHFGYGLYFFSYEKIKKSQQNYFKKNMF